MTEEFSTAEVFALATDRSEALLKLPSSNEANYYRALHIQTTKVRFFDYLLSHNPNFALNRIESIEGCCWIQRASRVRNQGYIRFKEKHGYMVADLCGLMHLVPGLEQPESTQSASRSPRVW